METWFWILGWVLSFLTILGNGFTIFLVCSRGNLRTKTNAFIVSLAVADFFVGLIVIPSLFFCDIANTCDRRPQLFIGLLFSNTSAANLCGLVLERLFAIVHTSNKIKIHRWCETQVLIGWNFLVSHHDIEYNFVLTPCYQARFASLARFWHTRAIFVNFPPHLR